MTTTPPEAKITVHEFIGGDARRAINVAGLVASDPALAAANLTEAAWGKRLQAWLDSPRP